MKMVDHVDEHKHKYGVCTIVSVAVIVPCCLLLIAATIYHFTHISHDKQMAASKGTTIPLISALPSKGDVTSKAQTQRRLNFKPNQNLRERLMGRSFLQLDKAVDPSKFDDLSDYSLFLDPQFVVGDPAGSHVDFVNMIRLELNTSIIYSEFFLVLNLIAIRINYYLLKLYHTILAAGLGNCL